MPRAPGLLPVVHGYRFIAHKHPNMMYGQLYNAHKHPNMMHGQLYIAHKHPNIVHGHPKIEAVTDPPSVKKVAKFHPDREIARASKTLRCSKRDPTPPTRHPGCASCCCHGGESATTPRKVFTVPFHPFSRRRVLDRSSR
jgi:hypothetical protein